MMHVSRETAPLKKQSSWFIFSCEYIFLSFFNGDELSTWFIFSCEYIFLSVCNGLYFLVSIYFCQSVMGMNSVHGTNTRTLLICAWQKLEQKILDLFFCKKNHPEPLMKIVQRYSWKISVRSKFFKLKIK